MSDAGDRGLLDQTPSWTALVVGLLLQVPAFALIGIALPEAEAAAVAMAVPLWSAVMVGAAAARPDVMSGPVAGVGVGVAVVGGLAGALYLWAMGGLVGATLFGDSPSPEDTKLARLLEVAGVTVLVGAAGAAALTWRCTRRRRSR